MQEPVETGDYGGGVDVTAIESDPFVIELYNKEFSSDKIIEGDAHQYLLDHYKEFDFIWSSPPCPSHSRARFCNTKAKRIYPDLKLYEEIIFLQSHFKGKWVVENVIPYYKPLIPAQEVGRHLFWSNFKIGMFEVEHKPLTDIGNKDYRGEQRKDKIARNEVNPEIGLYILNCAQNIITKQNEKQITLFE